MAPNSQGTRDQSQAPVSKMVPKANVEPSDGSAALTRAQKAALTRKSNAEKDRQREQQEMDEVEGKLHG
jgi:hypothetical protein